MSKTMDAHLEPLDAAAKASVIRRAGPHRAVEFGFRRNKRGKLVCVRARIVGEK